MRAIVQRAFEANCVFEGKIVASIDKGFMILVGFTHTDTLEEIKLLSRKIAGLRVFEDECGKLNKSIKDVNGSILAISQFTLYADCKKGNRPSFVKAGAPDMAEKLYEYVLSRCKDLFKDTQSGVFGADMKVSLVNDGPFTIVLDSDEIC